MAAGTKLEETYLIETQSTVLLRELVTLYLQWYQGPMWNSVNEVMTLPVEEAVDNPPSYAWYAACKFELAPFLSFSSTNVVMVAMVVCVVVWANQDLSLAFPRQDMIAGCNQILHPIREPPNRNLLAENGTDDSRMFENVTLPPGCANGSLLEALGMCKSTA